MKERYYRRKREKEREAEDKTSECGGLAQSGTFGGVAVWRLQAKRGVHR